MAFFNTRNVVIRGVSACVPSATEESTSIAKDLGIDFGKLLKITGVERRHISDISTCTSDLCYSAAEKLIEELNWERNEIDGLIFVTQTPDYILPATSPSLQQRLGLSKNCFTLDISLGCSGYVYGLSALTSFMQTGMIKKGLLLVGDTITKVSSPKDKSTYPLFGDAGTATALEYCSEDEGFKFNLSSDGSGFENIIIHHGGSRNPVKASSLIDYNVSDGICRNPMQLVLDGMEVFSFGISKAPESVSELLDKFSINKADIDYFFFHQANWMMNEQIRKMLQLPKEKVPCSLKDFGNTSSASIPLTMVTEKAQSLRDYEALIVGCGFGVGLSWGSFSCSTKNLIIPDLIRK